MIGAVVVKLAVATICFAGNCHNILTGKDTPIGVFTMTQYPTSESGYGGDILAFKFESHDNSVYAIHRVVNSPGQNRFQRIKSSKVENRINITNGCINVSTEVYNELVNCCRDFQLIIEK